MKTVFRVDLATLAYATNKQGGFIVGPDGTSGHASPN